MSGLRYDPAVEGIEARSHGDQILHFSEVFNENEKRLRLQFLRRLYEAQWTENNAPDDLVRRAFVVARREFLEVKECRSNESFTGATAARRRFW